MKKSIITIGIMIVFASVAFAQFSSLTPDPANYQLGVISGGDTTFVDVDIRNTNDEPISVQLYGIVNYTGDCDGRGTWQNNTDMVMSYCNSAGLGCDEHKIFSVPAFGTLPIKVKHVMHTAACPGTYDIENRIEFVEQEKPFAEGFGYFHDGVGGYQTPKGTIRIFAKELTPELRIELDNVHDGFDSRRCTITQDRMTFVTRSIICESEEVGKLRIFVIPFLNYISVGYGSKIMFRGVFINNI